MLLRQPTLPLIPKWKLNKAHLGSDLRPQSCLRNKRLQSEANNGNNESFVSQVVQPHISLSIRKTFIHHNKNFKSIVGGPGHHIMDVDEMNMNMQIVTNINVMNKYNAPESRKQLNGFQLFCWYFND